MKLNGITDLYYPFHFTFEDNFILFRGRRSDKLAGTEDFLFDGEEKISVRLEKAFFSRRRLARPIRFSGRKVFGAGWVAEQIQIPDIISSFSVKRSGRHRVRSTPRPSRFYIKELKVL